MEDFLVSMGVTLVLTSLKAAAKNPKFAESIKKAMMKIRAQIDILWPPETE